MTYNDSSFYPVAADKAGYNYIHTYWGLKGPYYAYRGSRTCYQYGYAQATIAASAWFDHYYNSKIGGYTIFADIERELNHNDGWEDNNGNYNITNNRDLLEGYLDGIVNYTRYGGNPGFNPGIYTRLDLWQTWFGGEDYNLERPMVVWLAGHACSISCSPCGTCITAKSEADNEFNVRKLTLFSKYSTVIWQFYISECPAPDCADYDIACQNGYIRFLPVVDIFLPVVMKNLKRNISSQSPPIAYPPP